MSTILSVKDLCKTYILDGYSNNVLRNVSFEMQKGEFISIMGPSGSGKSTLLYTVSGMEELTSGKVVIDGEDISKFDKKSMARFRLMKMGFIFQKMYMLKKLCVLDNILLPGYQSGEDRQKVRKRAEALMRRQEIIDIAEREISEISGGQLQRACLCRALINEPEVIFADEPTGALNHKAANDVMQELSAANAEGTALMVVTHSARVAARSDRVIYLVDGDIQGEIDLGRLHSENDMPARERQLNSWLMERGW